MNSVIKEGICMHTEQRRDLILKGNMYKVIITLALPIMINNLIQTLYNLVDGVWISKLGSVEFAATAFVWPVNFLFTSLGIGISIAGTSLLSQLIGASKYKEANEYVNHLVVLSFLSAVCFSAIGYLLSPWIIKLMGASGDIAYYGSIYLRITFLDLPFTFFVFNYNSIMNSQGNVISPTILGAISAAINVILDPIFIFTLHMGVGGAAIATLISKALLAFVGLILLINSKTNINLKFTNFRLQKSKIKKIIEVALPASIGQSGSAIGFMVLNIFIASYGTATMAAFGMVNRITSLIMQPAMGVGESLTAVIGQNLGIDQVDRAQEAFIKSIKITTIFSVACCVFLFVMNREIVHFFIQSRDDAEVITQAITYLKYTSISMPLMGIFSILQGVFQGSGHTRYSMQMEIGRLWFVRLPMVLLFKNLTQIGPIGIWFSMSFSNLIICLYGYFVYRKGKWKNKILKEVAYI